LQNEFNLRILDNDAIKVNSPDFGVNPVMLLKMANAGGFLRNKKGRVLGPAPNKANCIEK
jgi:hypothetical protein